MTNNTGENSVKYRRGKNTAEFDKIVCETTETPNRVKAVPD